MADPRAVATSYRYCRRIAQAAARNFYYAIHLLPSEKRNALCALYSFMRHADDISDLPGDVATKLEQMRAWGQSLESILAGHDDDHPAAPALRDAVSRFAIPIGCLRDLVTGTEMDLSVHEYTTFEALRKYCYHVAGTVGICCVQVFGYRDPRVPELAEKLGIAFQLTNILRDVKTDYQMGRVYLPQEEFAQYGCRAEELGGESLTPALKKLFGFQAERAWAFYSAGRELLELLEEDSRPALWALVRIYSELLREIERRGFDVFSHPEIRLSRATKLSIMLRARLGLWNAEQILEERHRDRRRAGGTVLGRRTG